MCATSAVKQVLPQAMAAQQQQPRPAMPLPVAPSGKKRLPTTMAGAYAKAQGMA